MIILAFTDMHESDTAFKELKKKASKADIILCAGDMTIFENDLDGVLAKIASLNKPTYLIHGNHEVASHVRDACKAYPHFFFVHKKITQIQDITLVGHGGGGFSSQDKDFENFFKKNKDALGKHNLLLTHAPPFGTAIDLVWDEEHAGCMSYRDVLKHFSLAIAGHIHETAGEQQVLGKTLLINPGPLGELISFP